MALYTSAIEKLYVTFFNRPADFNGLIYWEDQVAKAGGNSAAVANAFSASAEYQALYAGKSTSTIIDTIYQNLFGRAAEPDGLAYWGLRLDNGTFNIGTIANSIAIGAQNADITTIDNKVAAATAFTEALDTNAEILGYEHTSVEGAQAIKDWLKAVTSDAATLTAAQTALPALVVDVVAGASTNPGQTFTLTAGSDTLVGTAGNDTFNAGVASTSAGGLVDTLQNVDQLTGGLGIDTLNATLNTGGLVSPTLTGIENVNVRVTTATAGVNLVSATGVTTVTVNNSTAAANVQNTGAAALGVANQNTAVTFGGSTATALSLNLDTVGTAATDIAVNLGTTTANAATSFVITAKDAHVTFAEAVAGAATTSATVAATGANEITFAGADLASLTSLTVTGAGSADFTGGSFSALKTLTVGDGGAKVTSTDATAANLTATTGAGADTLVFNGANVKSISTGAGIDAVTLNTGALAAASTVSLGDGNDTITISGAAPTAGATIDAGAGTDTFATTAAIYGTVSGYTVAQRALISNFEVLSITDTLANGSTFDVSSLTGVGSFTAAAGVAAAGNATVTKLGAASTVTIAGANTATPAVAAVSEVQNVAVTGAATAQVTFLGTAVAASANLDTAAATVGRIVADKVALIAAWNIANPTLEILDLVAGAGTSIDITYKNTEGNVAELAASASAGINFALATQTTLGVAAAAAVAAGSLTATLATDTAADAMTLVLNNNYTDNNNTTIDQLAASNKFVATEVETLTVNATGKMATIVTKVDGYKADLVTNTLDLTGSNKLVTVTVTGDQALNFTSTAAMTKLATIDASANTGGLTFSGAAADVSTATSSAAMTIKGSATAANSLIGSGNSDTIVGGAAADTITGGAGADTLTGGAGNDIFVIAAATDSTLIKLDIITDFSANTFGQGALGVANQLGATATVASRTGDVINLSAATPTNLELSIQTNAADAQTAIQNAATDGAFASVNISLDSSSGKLYIDFDNNGTVDTVLQLTGVTTITTAAFII